MLSIPRVNLQKGLGVRYIVYTVYPPYYHTFSNKMRPMVIVELFVFLNNAHHTGNSHISNVFSMEALALINGIKSLFRNF